jgi:hypothetical protein
MEKMKNYQSLIIDLREIKKENIEEILSSYKQEYSSLLKENGSLWIICKFQFEKGEAIPLPFIIAENLKDLLLRNIILIPDFLSFQKGSFFDDCVTFLLFFSKGKKYYFNKDPIREKHIWKDVEWGKRKKNYHPLGKDPGNVWLRTEDDGKGNITAHLSLSSREMFERIIKVSSEDKEDCLLLSLKGSVLKEIKDA